MYFIWHLSRQNCYLNMRKEQEKMSKNKMKGKEVKKKENKEGGREGG